MANTPNGHSGKPDDPLKKILQPKPHHLDRAFREACAMMDQLSPQQRLEICTAQLLALVRGSGNDVFFSTNKNPPFCLIAAFGAKARDLLANNAEWLRKGDIK